MLDLTIQAHYKIITILKKTQKVTHLILYMIFTIRIKDKTYTKRKLEKSGI